MPEPGPIAHSIPLPPVLPPHVAAALARRRGERTGGGSMPGSPPEPSLPVQGRRGRPSHLITPLARVMKSNGHTNPQVAKYLGVGLRTVEYWVVGEKVIPKKYLPGLCKLYDREAEFFVYVDEDGSGVVITEESYRIAEEFFTAEYVDWGQDQLATPSDGAS